MSNTKNIIGFCFGLAFGQMLNKMLFDEDKKANAFNVLMKDQMIDKQIIQEISTRNLREWNSKTRTLCKPSIVLDVMALYSSPFIQLYVLNEPVVAMKCFDTNNITAIMPSKEYFQMRNNWSKVLTEAGIKECMDKNKTYDNSACHPCYLQFVKSLNH